MIKKISKPDNVDVRWVLRAIGKDHRPALTFLKVDEKNMVCTDGKRMHLAPNELKLDPGLYRVVVNKVNETILEREENDLTFPNYEMVIPQNHEVFDVDFKVAKHGTHYHGAEDVGVVLAKAYQAINRGAEGSILVPADKLGDAVTKINIDWNKIHLKCFGDVVMFTCEDGHIALVMPLRQ